MDQNLVIRFFAKPASSGHRHVHFLLINEA